MLELQMHDLRAYNQKIRSERLEVALTSSFNGFVDLEDTSAIIVPRSCLQTGFSISPILN